MRRDRTEIITGLEEVAAGWAEVAAQWRIAYERQVLVADLLWQHATPEMQTECLEILDQLDEITQLPERTP